MALSEKYLVYENIHTTKKDLSTLEWVKAPYRYRYLQRFLSSVMLVLSIFVMTFSSFLLFFAIKETPNNRYVELLQERTSLYIRDVLRNASRYQATQNYASTLAKLELLRKELTSPLSSPEKIEEYNETLAKLNLFLKGYVEKEEDEEEDDTDDEKVSTFPLEPTSLVSHLNNYRELHFYSSLHEKHVTQIEYVRDFQNIQSKYSYLLQDFDFPYPFALFLHYSRIDSPTLDTPYIDVYAPYQLLLSSHQTQKNIFSETQAIDMQVLSSEYNVLINLKSGVMRVDEQYYDITHLTENENLENLRAYFSPDLQEAILKNADLKSRVPNLIIALQIKPEEIYSLDRRPMFNKSFWENPFQLLSSQYNTIARAEQISSILPVLIYVLALALIVYIVFFSRLCSYAGYIANRHGEMPRYAMPSALFKLMWLDYLPLEAGILAYLWIYSWLLVSVRGAEDMVYVVPIFFFANSIGLLSIIRRYRGGVLLKHSLIYWILHLGANIRRHWRFSLGYLLLFLVALIALYTKHFWGVILVLILVFFLSLRYLMTLDVVRNRLTLLLKKNQDSTVRTDYIKSLQENLEELEALLSSSLSAQLKNEKLKTELITNVSHDLRTPLTSIVNYTGLLKKGDNSKEEEKDYIERIYQNSLRLQTMTEDLLAASKAASGALECENAVLDLNDFLKQVCGEWVDRFAEKDISLNYRIFDTQGNFCSLRFTEDGEESLSSSANQEENDKISLMNVPLMVDVDPNHLVRIFENLLSNCLKYSIKGSRVFLNVREQKKEDKLKENMILMPVLSSDGEETKSQILVELINTSNQNLDLPTEQLVERFVQGDRSRKSEGSGLGLAIVKSLAELLHIDFSIRLEEDSFKVLLVFQKYITLSTEKTEKGS